VNGKKKIDIAYQTAPGGINYVVLVIWLYRRVQLTTAAATATLLADDPAQSTSTF